MQSLSFRSILVASDLEAGSDAALATAARVAAATGAELHVVHAVGTPATEYASLALHLDVQQRIHAARRALRAQVERTVQDGVTPASELVRAEAASRAILSRAQEVGADLVVLGPHRPRAFHGPILGSTADRVLRTAAVPVLILRDPLRLPLREVVVPIDLSDPARGALDQALTWAAALGDPPDESGSYRVRVRVMHVLPRLFEDYGFPVDEAVVVPQLNREVADALERVGAVPADVRAEAVWGNAPADEISRYVQREGADLLVMGTHGYGALGRALIRSITSRVAREALRPLLLVPPPLWYSDDPAAIPVEVELAEPATPPA